MERKKIEFFGGYVECKSKNYGEKWIRWRLVFMCSLEWRVLWRKNELFHIFVNDNLLIGSWKTLLITYYSQRIL